MSVEKLRLELGLGVYNSGFKAYFFFAELGAAQNPPGAIAQPEPRSMMQHHGLRTVKLLWET